MKLTPYFNFKDTHSALKMYEALGGEITSMTLASDPSFDGMPNRPQDDFVMFASFNLLNQTFYASDSMDEQAFNYDSTWMTLELDPNNEDEVRMVKDFMDKAQELGGQITMPLGPAPWAPYFGMVKDALGITWQFSS